MTLWITVFMCIGGILSTPSISVWTSKYAACNIVKASKDWCPLPVQKVEISISDSMHISETDKCQ